VRVDIENAFVKSSVNRDLFEEAIFEVSNMLTVGAWHHFVVEGGLGKSRIVSKIDSSPLMGGPMPSLRLMVPITA
jgi:hypothetical protein